jgi:hypothetical protein
MSSVGSKIGTRGREHESAVPKDAFRRVSPVGPRLREGPLIEPTAGAQPWRRERVLLPPHPPFTIPTGIG